MGDPKLGDPEIVDPEIEDPEIGDTENVDPDIVDYKLVDPELGGTLKLGAPKLGTLKLGKPKLATPNFKPQLVQHVAGSHKYDLLVKKTTIWEPQIKPEIMWDGAYFSSSSLLANLQRGGNNIWKKLKFTCVVLL
jgi:hypothetical protein